MDILMPNLRESLNSRAVKKLAAAGCVFDKSRNGKIGIRTTATHTVLLCPDWVDGSMIGKLLEGELWDHLVLLASMRAGYVNHAVSCNLEHHVEVDLYTRDDVAKRIEVMRGMWYYLGKMLRVLFY